jgi:Holliday junction resolvase
MATTPENKVKAAVKRILDAHDVYYFPPATGGYGRSGVPDIICCVNGKFLAIECKAGKGKTTVLQDRELQAIRDAGGMAIVINEANIDYLAEVLKEFA